MIKQMNVREVVAIDGRALVIFSGGQDSTTCLGFAHKFFKEVHAITFFYGQRHKEELQASREICKRLKVPQQVVELGFFPSLIVSALTGEGDINAKHPNKPELPASFVPNRNALFMTAAHAWAQTIGADTIVIGASQTDYSGYPDCRQDFIEAMGRALNTGAETSIGFMAPLMRLSKAETFRLAEKCGVLQEVIELSHTCYQNDITPNQWGKGCGDCPACKLRAKGWREYLGQ